MNDQLFEQLLYEEEGTTLDFKKEQYHFARASDDEKSELLKDILGFANAWRRTEAYIVIGVEDVRGDRGIVHGILPTDHLADHAVQQFVNNLTNRPVRFQYEAFGFEGKQVGVIRIEEQIRPIYLKRSYGKLKANEVYVRRGSSTDPGKPASLEEIASMGQREQREVAELVVEFADTERDDSLGTMISLDAECCRTPPAESIPDLQRHRETVNVAGWLQMAHEDMVWPLNSGYLRQRARYEFYKRLFRPVRLVLANIGRAAAQNVHAEITIASADTWVIHRDQLPSLPKKRLDILAASSPALRDIRPALRADDPGSVTIDHKDERSRIEVSWGSLQPGRRIWSETFYVGKIESGELKLAGRILADNLPQPKDFTLTINANVQPTTMSVSDIDALPER